MTRRLSHSLNYSRYWDLVSACNQTFYYIVDLSLGYWALGNLLFFVTTPERVWGSQNWSTGDGPCGVLLQSELWEQEGKGDGRFVEIIVNRWTLWWSCGYYGGTVENMVDCCNWQYLAQFCLWRYFCWECVKIIFSLCPHLHFWCHCSCSLLKMIVKTKSKWQVPMSDAMKNKARLALSGGRDIDRLVGKESVNK